jgi:hypothetical protein
MTNKKQRKRKNLVLSVFLALAILCVVILGLIFLFPGEEKKNDFSELNGFYQLSYLEGYNFQFHNSTDGCDYSYKGINLKDGDKIVNARVLSNVLCKLCGKNETMKLPAENSKVSINLQGSDVAEGDMLFSGTGTELIDIKVVQ